MRSKTFMLAVLSAFVFDHCIGAKIVVLYPMGSKSHFYAVMPVIEELASRGHQLTVFTPFDGITKNTTNIREVYLPKVAQKINEHEVDWFAMPEQGATQFLSMMVHMVEFAISGCEELLANPVFRQIITDRDVDLFIVDAFGNEFTYPIIDKLGLPFVLHSSSSALPLTLAAMGAPVDYASVPTALVDFDDQMTFFQRLMNIVSGEILKPLFEYIIFNKLDPIVQREFPGVRPISELLGEASLYIANSHPVTNWPRSLPPTILPIGGLHARPAQPLTSEFKTFADEAKDGFIVFTLGSFVSVSTMPKKLVDTFTRVFSQLPQRVIWKWEADIPENIPPNIMMVKWVPQQDLLGHPNCRLFITHGGMLGTQESIYHGVPLLGLPFGNDQKANVARAVKDGWGLKLDWHKIDDETLANTMKHLINDPSVREKATKLSQLMSDEVKPGKDVAAYWIEYILRHGDTKHLQLASKYMPFYQQQLIDVAIFLILVLVIIISVMYAIIRLILRCCLPGKKVKPKMN